LLHQKTRPSQPSRKRPNLTVVLPIYEENPALAELHLDLIRQHTTIVIDRRGGRELKELPNVVYRQSEMCLSDARKTAISLVQDPFTLCLDADTVLPPEYISEALAMLEADDRLACVALDYEVLQGHLAFGTSLWKTQILQGLYNWKENRVCCECVHMWARARNFGYKIGTIEKMRAKHYAGT